MPKRQPWSVRRRHARSRPSFGGSVYPELSHYRPGVVLAATARQREFGLAECC